MSSISEDTDPSEARAVARPATAPPSPNRVTFNRLELNRILNLYGRMVADGDSSVTVTVDGEPYEAGIDPYNKLVDRVSDDNRMHVTLQ